MLLSRFGKVFSTSPSASGRPTPPPPPPPWQLAQYLAYSVAPVSSWLGSLLGASENEVA